MKKNQKISIKLIIAIIMILLIVIIITSLTLKQSKTIKEKNIQEEQQKTGQEIPNTIDINNLENAKIEEEIKENTSENVLKDRKINNIEITEIQLRADASEGISNFVANVKNNTGKKFNGAIAKITFTSKDGSEYATLEFYIPEMEVDGTNSINASTTSDITNAYDFTIEFEK